MLARPCFCLRSRHSDVCVVMVQTRLNDNHVAHGVRTNVTEPGHDVLALPCSSSRPLPGVLPQLPPLLKRQLELDAPATRVPAVLCELAPRRPLAVEPFATQRVI